MTKTQSKFNAATKRANRLQGVADAAKLEADALGKQWLAEVQAQIDPHAPVAAGVSPESNDPAFVAYHAHQAKMRGDVRPSFSGDAFGYGGAVAEAE